MRKKVDQRIRAMVENCVRERQRGLFVVVGDKGRDQVVNLHYMLSRAAVKARPSVLWCYKKDLGLSSHRKKRMKQIRQQAQRGLLDPESEDPFSLFVASTKIRYCFYHETQKVLGQTFGMCVLQDFEALTPNLLARTVETVEGGGLVIMLLSTLSSLSQLYGLTMDVHSRFRTESHQDVVGRFNERMVLSMSKGENCMLLDDELNILPTSSLVKDIRAAPAQEGEVLKSALGFEITQELKDLCDSLADTQPAGALSGCCRTMCQAKALVTFMDAASEKTLRSTVALTAARGRGKSAVLGLSIAGCIALGYSNIFVTAPSPENLGTLFEFLFKALDQLGYKEHIDYSMLESTNPEFGRAIVRVDIYRGHRQTVQYVQPHDHARLAQAELLVIDEAAAIPLPTVRSMLGPYLVFLCSTVNGYEGTGRSLSLKLIKELRDQGIARQSGAGSRGAGTERVVGAGITGRTFKEVKLSEPIRYASGDPLEKWLHGLLCLDASDHVPKPPPVLPHPDECELYYVERDTLFSYHSATEEFLQRMMALYIASHYRNTPNDLQMMSDAPAHHLFVLLGPVDEESGGLPDILCVVQVALEGAISRKSALAALSRGEQQQGDMVPWIISQQFQDAEFPQLSGARIVRISTHPEMTKSGYGSRAVQLLRKYYEGKMQGFEEADKAMPDPSNDAKSPDAGASGGDQGTGVGLHKEVLEPRTSLPPLLTSLGERKPEDLHYLGVAYGLTQGLLNFWQKLGFKPVYLRQTASDVTGENTALMIAPLENEAIETLDWVAPFVEDFRSRFLSLLTGPFRSMPPGLTLSLMDPKLSFAQNEGTNVNVDPVIKAGGVQMDAHDLKRLQKYSDNLVDVHLIMDLVPFLAQAYFTQKLPVNLSYGQAAILVCLGLQHKTIDDVKGTLDLPANQVLALFNKSVRKMHGLLRAKKEAAVERSLPKVMPVHMLPHVQDLDDDLEEAADEVKAKIRETLAGQLEEYAIEAGDDEIAQALGNKVPGTGVVSLKSKAKSPRTPQQTPGKDKKSKKQKRSDGKHSASKGKKHRQN